MRIHRRPARFTAVVVALGSVLLLLTSGLPTTSAASPASSTPPMPASAVVPSAPAPHRASPPLPDVGRYASAAVDGPNPSLCLLGVQPLCARGMAGAVSAAAGEPFAGPPSSWTNITPKPGSPNPEARYSPAEAYYPTGHDVILFGGVTVGNTYLQDTWSFSNGKWTEINNGTSCTASTCPDARAGGVLTYDPANQAMLLFGGYEVFPILHGTITLTYNDTWLFANGTWTDISSTAGTPPSPRFGEAMSYDPSDNYVLLFGGENSSGGALGDTWEFSAGTWHNLTATLSSAPEARAGMSMADSPNGWVMMFGGEVGGNIIQNGCSSSPSLAGAVALWFYKGAWSFQDYSYLCPPPIPAGTDSSTPHPAATSPPAPPCGRTGAALGWSPKNNRFVLYGGFVGIYTAGGATYDCSTTNGFYENDTWTYALPPGGGFTWYNASSPAGPPARGYTGYASDFTDGFFEIFGGLTGAGILNETWRFYEILYARLTGPSSINTQPGVLTFAVPFVLIGYGGTGDLTYRLEAKGLRNGNTLSGNGNAACTALDANTNVGLPYNGTWSFNCAPSAKAFNVYRITLTITDQGNTDHPIAQANWTFSILPPEAIAVYSEYVDYFYQTVNLKDTFGLFAEVSNGPATRVVASIGGTSVTFHQQAWNPHWWNASVQMSDVPKGAVLRAEAFFDNNWTQNVTYAPAMISMPSWLLSVFDFSGSTESLKSIGPGPWNRTYIINETYSWDLSQNLSFNLPVELLSGLYDVAPSMSVVFTLTSLGDLTVSTSIPLTNPSIDFGPATLQFYVNVSLGGTFNVVGSSIQWVSAYAELSVAADVSISIPIYGFSILGISVGFYLNVELTASFVLKLVLAPLQAGGSDLIPGIAIEIQQIIGFLTIGLSASVNFGIGIASVGLGAGISVALAMSIDPGFYIGAGWVNGSIFVTASFLFWSDSWNIASGTIYSWDPPGGGERPGAWAAEGDYNNGSGTTWSTQSRYYLGTGYDQTVWNPADSTGTAVSDIYPYTEVTGAAGYDGAYLFFTNMNASDPASGGLGISGLHLNPTTNVVSALPAPDDPGYLIVSPEATTLADGNLFVLWDALPVAEEGLASPLDLTSLALQGATFSVATGTWGAIETFSRGGLAESYSVDATGGAGRVLELVASSPLIGDTTPERLVEYNLTSGAVVANVSETGISEVVGLRGAAGLAVVESVGGNYSLANLASGSLGSADPSGPAGDHLVSATFVQDSPSALLLLYRAQTSSELVLYDATSDQTVATLTIGGDASQAEGILSGSTCYVFVRSSGGVEGWSELGGTFTNFTTIAHAGVASYGLVASSGSILVYLVGATGGNASDPIESLVLSEVGGSVPAVATPPGLTSPSSAPSAGPDYTLYLAVAAGVVVLLLAVVAVVSRRRPPSASAAPSPPAAAETPPVAGAGPPPSGPPPPGPPGG